MRPQRLGPILRLKQQSRIPKRRTGHGTPALREHTTLSYHPSHTSSTRLSAFVARPPAPPHARPRRRRRRRRRREVVSNGNVQSSQDLGKVLQGLPNAASQRGFLMHSREGTKQERAHQPTYVVLLLTRSCLDPYTKLSRLAHAHVRVTVCTRRQEEKALHSQRVAS